MGGVGTLVERFVPAENLEVWRTMWRRCCPSESWTDRSRTAALNVGVLLIQTAWDKIPDDLTRHVLSRFIRQIGEKTDATLATPEELDRAAAVIAGTIDDERPAYLAARERKRTKLLAAHRANYPPPQPRHKPVPPEPEPESESVTGGVRALTPPPEPPPPEPAAAKPKPPEQPKPKKPSEMTGREWRSQKSRREFEFLYHPP